MHVIRANISLLGRFLAAFLLLCTGSARAASPAPSAGAAPDGAGPGSAPQALRVETSWETSAWITWSDPEEGRAVAYEVLRDDAVVARTADRYVGDADLAAGRRYCYAVRAVDDAGRHSPRSRTVCVTTPDLTPPERPAIPAVSLDSATSVAVSWAPVADNVGVAGYEVLRRDRAVRTASTTRISDGGLRASQECCYAVVAVDRAGNRSGPSPERCFTVPDVTPPSPPQVVASGLPASVALAWAASSDDVGVAGYEVLRGDEVLAATRGLEATRGELAPGRHCFAVRALDGAGNRSTPAEACAEVPDTTPPTAPLAVDPSAKGETAVALRWSPASDDVGVTGYEVLRDERVVARGAEPEATEGGLLPFATYCYRVLALDAAGNRSPPTEAACVRTADRTAPETPAIASASALSDRALHVAWRPSTDNVGVSGYEVLREGAAVVSATSPEADVVGLSPGREYCVAVRAVDLAGNRSAPSAPACARTLDLTPPATPDDLVAAAASSARVALAWSASEDDVGVTGYEVFRGAALVARVDGTHAVDDGLAPSTEHCYQVRALDAAGNRSERSSPVCVRTTEPGTPAAPVALEAQPTGSRSVALRWTASPDAGVVYAVFWDGEKRIGSTRYASFKVDGLKPGERRCFQVAAVDDAGNSSPKTWPVCATTPSAPSASNR